jgi:hypothetical protein
VFRDEYIKDMVSSIMSSETALEILKSYVLKKIADDLCGQLGLKSMQDITGLSDEKIHELKITISQKRVLKALRDACVIIYLNSISV